jgi:hypothetical protein
VVAFFYENVNIIVDFVILNPKDDNPCNWHYTMFWNTTFILQQCSHHITFIFP